MILKVKAVNRCSQKIDDRNTVIPEGYEYNWLEDSALFSSNNYKRIFGKKRSQSCRNKKLLSVVKIKYNKHSIYRKYLYESLIQGINGDVVGLTPASIRELTEDSNTSVVGKEVTVSKACTFFYYWYHPFHATRISFRLGFPSLILGIIAFITSLFSIF